MAAERANPAPSERRSWVIPVDLTGSNRGEGWISCEDVGDWPWSAERVRREAAAHYEVPVTQVGEPHLQHGAKPKASDIADRDILDIVERLCRERGCWAMTGDVVDAYPEPLPWKVVAAKLSRCLKRGLVTGCDCGCRGDWELTSKGRALAGIANAWRTNPQERGA